MVARELELEAATCEAEGACGVRDVAPVGAQGGGYHLSFEALNGVGERAVGGRRGLWMKGGAVAEGVGVGRFVRLRVERGGERQDFAREVLGRNQCAVFGAGHDAL